MMAKKHAIHPTMKAAPLRTPRSVLSTRMKPMMGSGSRVMIRASSQTSCIGRAALEGRADPGNGGVDGVAADAVDDAEALPLGVPEAGRSRGVNSHVPDAPFVGEFHRRYVRQSHPVSTPNG